MRIKNECSRQLLNRIICIIFTLKLPQLAITQSLALSHTVYYQQKYNGTVEVESEAKTAFHGVGVVGLIAQPLHWFRRLRLGRIHQLLHSKNILQRRTLPAS